MEQEPKPVSRQRLYQRRKALEGKCECCGKAAFVNRYGLKSRWCEAHLNAQREYKRKTYRVKNGMDQQTPVQPCGRKRFEDQKLYTLDEMALLGTAPDKAVAELIGVHPSMIWRLRTALRIPRFSKKQTNVT